MLGRYLQRTGWVPRPFGPRLVPAVCVAVAAATVAGMTAPVHAQATGGGAPEPCACGYERFAFDVADSDGDGVVSEAELARDAAAGFSALDKDGSMTLTPQELEQHDPELFERVDRNGDGVLTFSEVMRNKVRGLEAGDKNGDGGLSFEEMTGAVAVEEEAAG